MNIWTSPIFQPPLEIGLQSIFFFWEICRNNREKKTLTLPIDSMAVLLYSYKYNSISARSRESNEPFHSNCNEQSEHSSALHVYVCCLVIIIRSYDIVVNIACIRYNLWASVMFCAKRPSSKEQRSRAAHTKKKYRKK